MSDQQYLPPKPTDLYDSLVSVEQVYPTPMPEQANPYEQPLPQPYQQPFPQQTYQQPFPPQPYQGQPYQQQPFQQQPFYQQPGYQMPEQVQSNGFALHLTLAIISFLLCGGLLAVPAAIFAIRMDGTYKRGFWGEYLKARKTCRIWLIVAFSLGLLANIFVFSGWFLPH